MKTIIRHRGMCSTLSALLLVSSVGVHGQANSGTPASESPEMISSYDSQHRSAGTKGLTASINTDPKYTESGGSLKLEPQAGFDLGTMQYGWRSPARTFNSNGLKFWAKATSQKVVLKVILSVLRPEPLGAAPIQPMSLFPIRGRLSWCRSATSSTSQGRSWIFPPRSANT